MLNMEGDSDEKMANGMAPSISSVSIETNYTIGKYGVAFMSSIQFNSLRFLVASPVLLLITF